MTTNIIIQPSCQSAAEPYPFVNIRLGDCYSLLPELPAASIDAIISDPPYATTDCKWDVKLDLPRLWAELTRIIKPGGAIVFTAAQPFTTDLINSNRAWFRHELIYHKNRPTGWLDANKRPLRNHENILVFCGRRTTNVYNPQKVPGTPYKKTGGRNGDNAAIRHKEHVYKAKKVVRVDNPTGERHPASVLSFSIPNAERGLHPTQKPFDMFTWLIKTYTNPGDLVFDPFCGSGTTGAAALATGRRALLIEKDAAIFLDCQQAFMAVVKPS